MIALVLVGVWVVGSVPLGLVVGDRLAARRIRQGSPL